MTSREMVFYLSETFPEKVRLEVASDKRLYVRVQPEDLHNVIHYICESRKGRLSTVTGLETPDGIEVLYHFAFNGFPLVMTVRVTARKYMPELDSVQDIVKGAYWIEREIHEMLGVVFKGHPNLTRLIKAREIPEDTYPLRKDFDIEILKEHKGEA
ncbi:NADH-quinone oxidoreductase subunit C [candidate division KSB1 bacterium]